MEKSKVAVIACDNYNQETVDAAIKRGLDLLGGIEKFVQKNEKILLKPNFLTAKKPEDAVTTHPAIFSALVDELQEHEYEHIYYGDSPGFGSSEVAAKVSGFAEIAEEKNVELLDFNKGKTVHFPQGHVQKVFEIANGVMETDALISLSKMKTHAMTRLTGAIKNQFGIIYGFNKATYHSTFPDITDFSKALIDINRYVKPRLYIMDGVIAMEGNGPKNGTPTKMGVILMSEDGSAVDTVFAHLVDMEPTFLPTIQAARELGYGATRLDEIELVGDDINQFINKDFKAERFPARGENAGLGFGFLKGIRNHITRRPVLNPENCISCGVCEAHCPQEPKAITMEGDPKRPKYNYKNCIRCFCCQELCPNNAITVKTPLLGKLFIYR